MCATLPSLIAKAEILLTHYLTVCGGTKEICEQYLKGGLDPSREHGKIPHQLANLAVNPLLKIHSLFHLLKKKCMKKQTQQN